MKEEQRRFAILEERVGELRVLGSAFDNGDGKSKQQWVAECAAVTKVYLDTLATIQEKVSSLTAFGAAMWQAGYEAAPSLQFVLPEGAGG